MCEGESLALGPIHDGLLVLLGRRKARVPLFRGGSAGNLVNPWFPNSLEELLLPRLCGAVEAEDQPQLLDGVEALNRVGPYRRILMERPSTSTKPLALVSAAVTALEKANASNAAKAEIYDRIEGR